MRSLLVSLCLVAAVSGCAPWRMPPPAYENPIRLPPMPRDYMWEHIVDVVDDYFEIEREERSRVMGNVVTVGRIDTFPAVGSTLLEPWKGDSATQYEKLECTLQSERRRAVVQVIPTEDGGALVDMTVYKELEDVPQPEQASTASATFQYNYSLNQIAEPVGAQPVPLGWIGRGRDPALEQKMLCKLMKRMNKRPPFGPNAPCTP
jgi:hypothetical protein